jgi:rhodanese-related sulfurtransferase
MEACVAGSEIRGSRQVAIDPEQVRRLLDRGEVRLLDVRTPAEFESVHIPGAYNVPLGTLAEHGEELRRHVDGPVVLVCRSGSRARQAEEALREIGMTQLHVLDGGMEAWERAGFPVRRGERQRWGLERQVRLVAGSLVLLSVLAGVFVARPLVWIAAMVGAGLVFSAVTNTCGLALLLAKLPYNRGATCDVRDMVRALAAGEAAPAAPGRTRSASEGVASHCA